MGFQVFFVVASNLKGGRGSTRLRYIGCAVILLVCHIVLVLREIDVALFTPAMKPQIRQCSELDFVHKTPYLDEDDPGMGLILGCCFDISSRCLAFSMFN